MTPETHPALLRRAAARLREVAGAATEGPWEAMGDLVWPDGGEAEGDPVCGTNHDPDATYIATMHPGMGLALADYLDLGAEAIELVVALRGADDDLIVTTLVAPRASGWTPEGSAPARPSETRQREAATSSTGIPR